MVIKGNKIRVTRTSKGVKTIANPFRQEGSSRRISFVSDSWTIIFPGSRGLFCDESP